MKNKELLVITQQHAPPQYGGRTLIEKVTAYKLSDGELIEGKEAALECQKNLDRRRKIYALVEYYLKPHKASLIEEYGMLEIDSTEVISAWRVRDFLYHCVDQFKGVLF